MNLLLESLKKDYKGMVAIQCHCEREWEETKKILNSTLGVYERYTRKGVGYDNPCMNINGKAYCSEEYYGKQGYMVLQAKDFIKYNPKKIEYEIY